MDIGSALEGITGGRPVILVYFIGFFVLGFAQGPSGASSGSGRSCSRSFSRRTSRSRCRTSSPPIGRSSRAEYSYMIGFLTIFVAGVVAFALVIQTYYEPQPLFGGSLRGRDHRRPPGTGRGRPAVRGRPRHPDSSSASRASRPTRRSCRSFGTSGTRSTRPDRRRSFRTRLIPAFFFVSRVLRAGQHRGELPAHLSVIDRSLLAAPTRDGRAALLGARLVRDDATGRRVGPDRRGRGVHRP